MTTIYLLWASDGEYDDRVDWVVCAYSKKDDAVSKMKGLQEEEEKEEYPSVFYSVKETVLIQ